MKLPFPPWLRVILGILGVAFILLSGLYWRIVLAFSQENNSFHKVVSDNIFLDWLANEWGLMIVGVFLSIVWVILRVKNPRFCVVDGLIFGLIILPSLIMFVLNIF